MIGKAAGNCARICVVPDEPRELLVSVFSTSDGGPLGKVRGLDANGRLRKAARAALANGRVEQQRFTALIVFLQAVDKMRADEAIGFGVSEFESARVVTKERLAAGAIDGPAVARTKECFSFRQGGGILHVDYDPLPGDPPLSAADVVKLLRAAVPELKGVTMGSKPSSSSHLSHPDGSSLVDSSGAHIFIPVQDASLIPKMGQTIVDRLWLWAEQQVDRRGSMQPALVIIDTLAQVMCGGDENSGVDMGKALKACRKIHERVDAMVLLVHHSGKDRDRGARGWSGLRAAADVEICVSRTTIGNVARITKMKDGEDGAAYNFKLVTVRLPANEDGQVSSCVVVHVEGAASNAPFVHPRGVNQKAVFKAAQDLVSLGGGGHQEPA